MTKTITYINSIMKTESELPSLKKEDVLVEWSNLGEGWEGDYNPNDPDDENLLRFDITYKDEPVSNASYCTQIPADTDEEVLTKGLEYIMDSVYDLIVEGESVKMACANLSWLNVEKILDK